MITYPKLEIIPCLSFKKEIILNIQIIEVNWILDCHLTFPFFILLL